MRKWLAILVALGLAPGTFVRIAPDTVESPWVSFERLALPERAAGPFTVQEGWRITSKDSSFGGYSALAWLGPAELLALSDRGGALRFSPPRSGTMPVRLGPLLHFSNPWWNIRDFEAVAHDPRTGSLWASFESRHGLARVKPDGWEAIAFPPALREWGSNSGAEAMARLPDGRFLVLAESDPGWFRETTPGLLYPTDPVSGAEPLRFRLSLTDRYRPTDLAVLPDGRLLLLARRVEVEFPPRFSARLLLADPGTIRHGRTWTPQLLATIADPMPNDNFEGLTVAPGEDGRLVAWMISDDNFSALQDTLLIKLSFDPAALGK